MWDLVGNPEDRFSQNEAHLDLEFLSKFIEKKATMIACSIRYETKNHAIHSTCKVSLRKQIVIHFTKESSILKTNIIRD